MAKDFKTFDRKIKILLDINTSPLTVPVLANRYKVSENTIYEYIKWYKLRFPVEESSDKYSVKLSDEEVKAYKRFVSPRTGRNASTTISLLPFYNNIEISSQSYSHQNFSSIFDEFSQE